MSLLRRALLTATFGATVLMGLACRGHEASSWGIGGSGKPECHLVHADSYGQGHPNSIQPQNPHTNHEGEVKCQ